MHISGSQIHYLSSTKDDGTDDYCEQMGWRSLHEYDSEQSRWKYLSTLTEAKTTQEDGPPSDEELEEGDYLPSLPFASLFTFLKVRPWNIIIRCQTLNFSSRFSNSTHVYGGFKAKGIKVTCLLCYCSEGDNIPDAFNLAEATGKLLGLRPGNLLASPAIFFQTSISLVGLGSSYFNILKSIS